MKNYKENRKKPDRDIVYSCYKKTNPRKERKHIMKRNMMEWVDSVLAEKKKKGFLVLSFPAIQKMGITVKDTRQGVQWFRS